MKLLALMLSLLAVSGAAATFGRESAVAYFARSPALAAFNNLAYDTEKPPIPLSLHGMRDLFTTCGSVQQGLLYTLQTSETRMAVDAACGALARAVLERNPTYSAAHTIQMFSATGSAEITQALILSQLTAPRESWHAKLRLIKGMEFYGSGMTSADDALDADIRFLVQTFSGRAWLAKLYRQDIASRPALARVIETRPDNEKAAFLREVRSLGQD